MTASLIVSKFIITERYIFQTLQSNPSDLICTIELNTTSPKRKNLKASLAFPQGVHKHYVDFKCFSSSG